MSASATLILSAGMVADDLVGELGPVASGAVPLGGEPTLAHILRRIAPEDAVTVSIRSEDELLRQVIGRIRPSADIIYGDPAQSLGEACARAIREANPQSSLRIIFGDTIVEREILDDAIVVSSTPDAERWTTVVRGLDGHLEFRDKLVGEVERDVCVGVFSVSKANLFLDLLEAANSSGRPSPFFEALRRYDETIGGTMDLLVAEDWIDVGHLDTYYEARRRWLVSRYFNNVVFDEDRGTLRKQSTHRRKLQLEVNWYQSLPAHARQYAPRLLDWDDQAHSWYELEYLPCLTGADLFVHGALNRGFWRRFFQSVDDVLDALQQDEAHGLEPTVRSASGRSMIVDKTLHRLHDLMTDPPLRAVGDGAVVNGIELAPLEQVLETLEMLCERHGVFDDRDFTRIHGDFFLANMLVDRRSSLIRLVDPRGSYGFPGQFGDPAYDLAKLSHSFHGGYDFIVNGLYDLRRVDHRAFEFTTFAGEPQAVAAQIFDAWLRQRAKSIGMSVTGVRVIEMALFLSMSTLHREDEQRQLAFLIRGLQLHDEIVRSLP